MGKAITLKTPQEIQIMREANTIVAAVLKMLAERMASGQSTWQLDRWAEDLAREHGAEPAFKGYHGYPASLCVSVNEEVVHGIPSKKMILKDGDIVSIDFGVKYLGFYGDAAVTVPIGPISARVAELIEVTEQALHKGIAEACAGKRVGDISRAVQSHVERHGFSIVRQFVGHGIGSQLHEGPEIPNYGSSDRGIRLQPGMVLAIEPMVNMGGQDVEILKDGWTADRKSVV